MFKKNPWFLQLFLNFLAFHLFQQNSPCSSVNILQTFSLCCCLWNQSQRGIAGQGEELITPALVSWKLGANKCPGLWITWASSADTAQPWTTQTSLQSVYSNVSHPLNPPTFRYLLQKNTAFPSYVQPLWFDIYQATGILQPLLHKDFSTYRFLHIFRY